MPTRKDFERAAAFYAGLVRRDEVGVLAHNGEVRNLALQSAAAFAESNPRFDEARFMAACGFRWCDGCKSYEATASEREGGRCRCDVCVACDEHVEAEWQGQQP